MPQNISIPALRLASHRLLPVQNCSIKDLVVYMGAMQAQDYNMVKWAIGIRLQGIKDKDAETAINNGEVLRTHVMRPTWHLVAPQNIRWMLALTAPKIKSAVQSRDRNLGLTENTFEKSNMIIAQALSGNKHLTKEELSYALENAGIPTNPYQLTHIIMRAELDAVICNGAIKRKKQTYALIDERVPVQKILTIDEALKQIAYNYFSSHSPATIDDFTWWSGLSKADARKSIEMNQPQLYSETIDGKTYWIDKNLQAAHQESVHLLPAFDEYIISYRDRSAVLPTENHSKAVSSNGIFRPVIIENGIAIGLWRKVTQKNKPTVETNYFKQPNKKTEERVQEKILEFESFFEQ